MKKLLLAVSIAAMCGSPAMAGDGGWYVRGNVGYGTHTDMDFENGALIGDVESEGGGAGSIGIGYDFGHTDFGSWRLELDGDTMWTDLGAIGQQPASFAKLRTNTLMLNAIYDFAGYERWEPYVGAGVGYVQGDLSAQAHAFLGNANEFLDNPACLGANSGACAIDDKDGAWGYQLLAGLGYKINENLTWDTHYTFMQVEPDGLDFDTTFTPSFAAPAAFTHRGELNDVGAHTLMTGFRYSFGGTAPSKVVCWDGSYEKALSDCPSKPAPEPVMFTCWDGSKVENRNSCPAQPAPEPTYYTCWDGSQVLDTSTCPAQPAPQTFTCWDGSLVYDAAQCPAQQIVSRYNDCGPNNVAIFNVPANATPKQMPRLGTMPEFGDSHDLTAAQFFEKLQSRYNSNATDKAYLNYLFKSMGYDNGFADAQAYMFSEDVIDVGTSGMLGLGEQHHYQYAVLPSSDRDRQAFRIQSANGSAVYFMKTCGNYFYPCN